MRSVTRLGLVRPLMLASLMLGVAACAGAPPIVTASNASGCSALVPNNWRLPVQGAPIPDQDTVGDWIAFGDAQTGKLDMANGRTADAIGIVEKCEARDRAAVVEVTKRRRVLGIF